jgi:protein-S-isoprenylcysteine O-methyltransferase Ste14
MTVAVILTLCAWAALEAGLLTRDQRRDQGSSREQGSSRDRGTRVLITVTWFVALAGAGAAAAGLRHEPAWQTGRWHLAAALALLWAGLALRVWAVLVLGSAFRSTVEVEAGQAVVDHGPYRLVRHPSYTGALISAAGVGLLFGSWLSLAIVTLLSLASTLRRISVEEAALTEVLGESYLSYRQRTKRLLPGLW